VKHLLAVGKQAYKITPRAKSGGGLGLGALRKIMGFPYNISAMAGASDFQYWRAAVVCQGPS